MGKHFLNMQLDGVDLTFVIVWKQWLLLKLSRIVGHLRQIIGIVLLDLNRLVVLVDEVFDWRFDFHPFVDIC